MSTTLLNVAMPFFLGLFSGQALRPRCPNGGLAHALYGIGGVGGIWLFTPNPLGLPVVVTVLGLVATGMLVALFDVRRLGGRRPAFRGSPPPPPPP